MTLEIQTQLARLRPFAGIPSYARQIAALELSLSSFDGVSIGEFTARNAAQDVAIGKRANEFLGAQITEYYIGGEGASDELSGLTDQSPKATLNSLFKVMDLASPNRVNLLGPVTVGETFTMSAGVANIDFSSDASEEFDLTITGEAQLAFGAGANLRFINTHLRNDKTDGKEPILITLSGGIRTIGGQLTHTIQAQQNNPAAMFHLSPFVQLLRTNTITDAFTDANLIRELVDAGFASRRAVTG